MPKATSSGWPTEYQFTLFEDVLQCRNRNVKLYDIELPIRSCPCGRVRQSRHADPLRRARARNLFACPWGGGAPPAGARGFVRFDFFETRTP